MRSYNAIIEKTLSQAIQLGLQSPRNRKTGRHGIAGFCMLQGPTGGGKSSGLFRRGADDNLPPALEKIKKNNHQAIFITHRWNILHDVYDNVINSKDTSGESLKASVIYAQDENIISALTRRPLPHEIHMHWEELPDPLLTLKNLNSDNLLRHKKWNFSALHRTARKIISEAGQLENRNIQGAGSFQRYLRSMQKELQRSCSRFEFMLLKNMMVLESDYKKAKEKYGSDSKLTEVANRALAKFRSNQWIRRVFPGIAWKDDEQHLLIMTTQKLFSSFYDGNKKVRISSNELQGHIVFIDEFDYQADVLQQQLAQSQLVHEPPECLGQLLDGGGRLLKRMQFDDTGRVPEIRERLAKLLDSLEEDLNKNNINLNEARALVIPIDDYKKGKKFSSQFLFRADHMVTSNYLSMSQASHGFEVEERKYGGREVSNSIDIDKFLRLMEEYIRKFSLMLSDFSSTEGEERDLLKELSSLLFDPANDYRPSHYSSALPNLSLFALPQAGLVELDDLRKSNILPNTHANIYGLTNWQLRQNDHEGELDRLRIQIRRAFLPTTPEGLLVSLASRNMVFGLSATSYIERAIGHFDIRWIQSALHYVAEARNSRIEKSFLGTEFSQRPKDWFKRPIPYVQNSMDVDAQDEMISFLSHKKAELRDTDLNATTTDFSDKLTAQEKVDILSHLSHDFFQESEAEISDITLKFRQDTLCKLINVLATAADTKSVHQGQIAFVNSAKYFKLWLTEVKAQNSRESIHWFRQASELRLVLKNNERFTQFEDIFVPIQVHGKELIVCLLNAECQKRAGFKEAYQAAFDTGCTVLIVTQTASATNGINLDFESVDGGRMDLTCLYILESRHFYFSSYDTSDEKLDEMAHAGSQMRNLDKLRRYGEISRNEHRNYISSVMESGGNRLSQLNTLYKTRDDYIKNTAADIQQQVGRLERVWEKVGSVSIFLCHSIAQDLIKFTALPLYANHKHLLSDLNKKLLDTLLVDSEKSSNDFFSTMFTPVQSGEKAVQIIDDKLVPAIRNSRLGSNNVEDIAKLWEQLGRAVLQLDYAWNPSNFIYNLNVPLKDWACIEKPRKTSELSEIWYDPKNWQFFDSNGDGRIPYRPDRLYRYIQSHSAIVDWFNKKGFRTSMSPIACELEANYILHPHVVQRILQGRLGEESIRALLKAKNVMTHTRLNSPRVLELYDFTILDSDYRVDAKFWGSESLNNADEEFSRWKQLGENPDKAPLDLINKLKSIRCEEGEHIKLAILNFVSNESDAKLFGFDEKLSRVQISDADIVILNGCLCSDKKETLTTGFDQFVNLVFEQQYKSEV